MALFMQHIACIAVTDPRRQIANACLHVQWHHDTASQPGAVTSDRCLDAVGEHDGDPIAALQSVSAEYVGERLRLGPEFSVAHPSLAIGDGGPLRCSACDACDPGCQRAHSRRPQASSLRVTNSSTDRIESKIAGVISSGDTEILKLRSRNTISSWIPIESTTPPRMSGSSSPMAASLSEKRKFCSTNCLICPRRSIRCSLFFMHGCMPVRSEE